MFLFYKDSLNKTRSFFYIKVHEAKKESIWQSWSAMKISISCVSRNYVAESWNYVKFLHLKGLIKSVPKSSRSVGLTDIMLSPHFFSISHCLSVVGLRPSSSLSTGCVVSLRGDWAIFCHAGSGRVGRVRSAREKSLEILRRGWELNLGHGEDRQRAIPLSYHDCLLIKDQQTRENLGQSCGLSTYLKRPVMVRVRNRCTLYKHPNIS